MKEVKIFVVIRGKISPSYTTNPWRGRGRL